ncbi:MAG: hypothetical protein AAGF01_01675 [Cyanobacteria bacterium P01_G01_bin.38]
MTSEEKRFELVKAAVQGLLASESDGFIWEPLALAARATEIADAVLARLADTGG